MAGMLNAPPMLFISLLIRKSKAVQRCMSSRRLAVGFSPTAGHSACWLKSALLDSRAHPRGHADGATLRKSWRFDAEGA